MTGIGHYREAERLLGLLPDNGNVNPQAAALVFSQAQVHATLALAVKGTDLWDYDNAT